MAIALLGGFSGRFGGYGYGHRGTAFWLIPIIVLVLWLMDRL